MVNFNDPSVEIFSIYFNYNVRLTEKVIYFYNTVIWEIELPENIYVCGSGEDLGYCN